MASASTRGEQSDWSNRLTLAKAASRAPVLVRVEERHRGNSEETTLSPGDLMGLHSCTIVNGRSVVLVHCKSTCDIAQAAGSEEDVRRGLMVIPLDIEDLAQIEVSFVGDPYGQFCEKWVKRNFPTCSWANREASAQNAMASCTDLREIVVLPAARPAQVPPTPIDKPQPIPTPLSIPELQPLPTGFAGGKEALDPPDQPPRPPYIAKTLNRSVSYPEHLSHLTSLPPPLPPRPPRHHSVCEGQKVKECSEGQKVETCYEIEPDGDWSQQPTPVFFFTFADMAPPPAPPQRESHHTSQAPSLPDKKKVRELGKELGGVLKTAGSRILRKITRTKTFDLIQEQPSATRLLHSPTSPVKIFDLSQEQPSATRLLHSPTSPVPSSTITKSSTSQQPVSCTESRHYDVVDHTEEYVQLDDSKADDHLYLDIDAQATVKTQCQVRGSPPTTSKSTAEEKKKVTTPESSASEQIPRRTKKPTMHVRPVHNCPPSPVAQHPMMAPGGGAQTGQDAVSMEKMSVPELAARLELCGMSKTAQICRDNLVDGRFFAVLTKEKLKAEPFLLNDWDITRVFQVKTGWIPHK